MNTAPIIVFAYNRPDHLRKTLTWLGQNELADQSTLYVFCDGPKPNTTDEQLTKVENARKVAHELAVVPTFKEVHIIEREENLGLGTSVITGVTEIINKHGRAIVLEDDLLTSPFFLTYMNRALELYEEEDRVMHVSAYMWPHRGSLPDTFFSDIPNSWGWATWSRAWKYFCKDSDFLYHMFEHRWEEFNKFGGDLLQKQLVENYNGRLSTWYIKWYSMILLRNGLTLYPGKSLIGHIGMDGSGTNCSPSNSFNEDHLALDLKIEKRPLEINHRAGKEIFAFYQGRWYNRRRRRKLMNDILRFLRLKK